MAPNVFAVPVFFIVFRETLEVVIIVSILLAFLKQTLDGPQRNEGVYKKLVRQVWLGTGISFLICLIIGGGLIGAFYGLGHNAWSKSEYYFEGAFCLFASLIITLMGAALLRVAKMQEKWRVKLAIAMEAKLIGSGSKKGGFKRWCEKYAMFILPFITVFREGIEAIVFIAGVTFSSPASSVPLPVFCGLLAGCAIGYLIYRGGSSVKLQYFLVVSTCLLYLVAAGLFSRGVWFLEAQAWNIAIGGDAAETGSGPGSYDIGKSVWHINHGNPELNAGGGWGVFNSILGWQNSATYGSVISYNIYWLAVILMFVAMRYHEVKGHWPLMKAKSTTQENVKSDSVSQESSAGETGVISGKKTANVGVAPSKEIS